MYIYYSTSKNTKTSDKIKLQTKVVDIYFVGLKYLTILWSSALLHPPMNILHHQNHMI